MACVHAIAAYHNTNMGKLKECDHCTLQDEEVIINTQIKAISPMYQQATFFRLPCHQIGDAGVFLPEDKPHLLA